jgi:hypothetical protein
MRGLCALLLCAGVSLLSVAPAGAASSGSTPLRGSLGTAGSTGTATSPSSTGQATSPEAPVPVQQSLVPPAGRRLSADQVLAIAKRLPKMRAVTAKYPGSYAGAYLKGPLRWQVSFFSRNGAQEIGQVIIADASGEVLEQWTGFQVAWTMARGYPGAFGRHVNALYIWLALCLLFALPFIDPRRPFSLLHLDLLMLLSLSVSLAFFNHANIYASVPLAYPPLLYLLARMLVLLRPGRRSRDSPAREQAAPPLGGAPVGALTIPAAAGEQPGGGLRLLVPVPWLALGLIFLIAFRITLNVTDSNVIDVGYAGVIGAERLADGRPLYGSYPSDNEHGDTYGPVNYEAYAPFEQIFGWSGTWDDLPAAHAAAIVFDLLAIGLLFLLGRRVRGPALGIALAYAWASYPFTLYVLESNSNDALVAVFVLAALLVASSAPARGVFAGLAGLTKFAPLALAPVLATYRLFPPSGPLPARPTRWRRLGLFALAFLLTVAVVAIPAVSHDSLHTIFERTIVYQANRGSPFSVWGLYGGLHGVQSAVQIAAVVLAFTLAVIPRRQDLVGLAASCAAVLVAVQLGIDHWFYLYIPWFFPLVMLALLGARAVPRIEARPVPAPAEASGSARSHPLEAAASSG